MVEEDKLQLALDIIRIAKEKNVRLFIPTDTVVADKFANDAKRKPARLIRSRMDGWDWISAQKPARHMMM
jgi:phosphoglycerate kinase